MARILGGTLIACIRDLEWAAQLFAQGQPEATQIAERAVEGVALEANKVPLSQTFMDQVKRFRRHMAGGPHGERLPDTDLSLLLSELREALISEMVQCLFVAVPPHRRRWYQEDDAPLFGDEIDSAFPDTTREIAEAGRCYALARWTACVFHLMRALEKALHKWMKDLGAPIAIPVEQANWQDILNSALKHLRALEQQPKSQQRDDDLTYFGETLAHFLAIKNAWRNHVSHSKVVYDERAADSILRHAGAFMETLAARP